MLFESNEPSCSKHVMGKQFMPTRTNYYIQTWWSILGSNQACHYDGGFTVHCITIDASTPNFGAPGRTRTVTLAHWLLRPACLPIPPPGHNILKHTRGNAILLSQYVGCCLICFNMVLGRGIEPLFPP